MTPGTLIGGKYRLTRQLGSGAMGVVWAAVHEKLSRNVAIKLILQSNEELKRRLLREARACGALRHPNIVEVLDVDEPVGGDPYLVMQLLAGETLGELLNRQRRLDPSQAARIAYDVAQALVAAHAAGIIHRDLKPANIFLSDETGPDGRPTVVVKVLDFGVAKNIGTDASDGLATMTGGMVGSPAYMSPEQVQARRDIDGRSDLWSLGVVMFEMLTGKRPFQGEQAQVLTKIIIEQAPSVSQFVRHADSGLVAIVARCLERDLARRVPTATALLQMLAPFCGASAASTPRAQLESIVGEAPPPSLSPFNPASAPAWQPPSQVAPLATPGADGEEWAATARLDPRMLAPMAAPAAARQPRPSPAAGAPQAAPPARAVGNTTLPLDNALGARFAATAEIGSLTAPLPPGPMPSAHAGGANPMRPITFGTPVAMPNVNAGSTAAFGKQTVKLTPEDAARLPSSPFSPASQSSGAQPPPSSISGSWQAQLGPASAPGTASTNAPLMARPAPGATDSNAAALATAGKSRRTLVLVVVGAFLAVCLVTLVVLRAVVGTGTAPAIPGSASAAPPGVSALPTADASATGAPSGDAVPPPPEPAPAEAATAVPTVAPSAPSAPPVKLGGPWPAGKAPPRPLPKKAQPKGH
jgi:serine/threonine-protein kinase